MTIHEPEWDFAGCSCGSPGWISTLACGHRSWSHGPPKIGSWMSCYPALGLGHPSPPGTPVGCQAQRQVVAVEPGERKPAERLEPAPHKQATRRESRGDNFQGKRRARLGTQRNRIRGIADEIGEYQLVKLIDQINEEEK